MEDIIETTEDGMVRIIFEKMHEDLVYRDAIYYKSDEYATIDPAEIEAEKVRRFNNWVTVITTPAPELPAPIESTPL